MDPIPVSLAVPYIPLGCSPPHRPHIIAGVPKAVVMPETEGPRFNGIGDIATGEPKDVCANPSVCARRDKVMGSASDRLNFRCSWESQWEPAHLSHLLLPRHVLALQELVTYKDLFIRVTDAVGQESGQGIVGPACLCFVMSGALAGKAQQPRVTLAGWFDDGGSETSGSATGLRANADCQLRPPLGLSTEASTYGLPKWPGLPHSMVALRYLHDKQDNKHRCKQGLYVPALEVT